MDIIKCREVLKREDCWVIGNGTHIHILDDPWVPMIPTFMVGEKSNRPF